MMSVVSNNVVCSSGFQHLQLKDETAVTLKLEDQAEVFLEVLGGSAITIKGEVNADANARLVVWNRSETPVHFDEEYDVRGSLVLAYGDANLAEVERKSVVHLNEQGAFAQIKSATLCAKKKHYVIDCISHVPHTEGLIENYSVVLVDGDYYMEATGKIDKGAYQSKSHQTSRALSMAEPQKSVILPKLLIDENDVEASHATSVGRMDEDQLIYMQSRGLTLAQALSLVSSGYLMPVTGVLSDEQLSMDLKEEIERLVETLCS